MNTLIRNTLIIPMTEEGLFFTGSVGIQNDTIVFAGKEPEGFHADKIIDGTNSILMPSFVNTHTHLAMELMRNYKDQQPDLMSWLSEIFPIEDKLTPADIKDASLLGCAELIKTGCTLFNDMYFEEHMTAQAVNTAGLRAVIGITLFGDKEETLRRLNTKTARLIPEIEKSDSRIRYAIAPHAIYTCTEDTYKEAHRWAKEHGVPLHTHLSETRTETEGCKKEHNTTPYDYLESIGYFENTDHILAHGVHLTESEMDKIGKNPRIAVCTNPTSNAKLASGTAPVARLTEKGVHLCLGTDGSASNNNLNMVEEMHLASMLSATLTGDISSLSPYTILKMATVDGARALGEKRIGTIEKGMQADMILLNRNAIHMTPLNNPFSALVYSAQASDITHTFCKGKLLMENRKLLTLDENQIIRDVNKRWSEILSR